MSASNSSFRPRDAVLLLLLALIWGNSFLLIKLAVAQLSPLWVVTSRMASGGLLLLAICVALRTRLPRSGASLGWLFAIGVAGCALPWACQAWAQQFLDSGLVAVLNAFTPVATLLMAVVSRQERLHRNRMLGLAIAVVGTLVVVRGEVRSGSSPVALVAAVLATVGYALSAVLARAHVSGRIAPLPAAATQLCLGAIALGPFALALSGPPPSQLAPGIVLAVLTLGLLGTGIAFLLYFTLIQNVGATNSSMVTYLTPVVAMVSGALFRGERFGANVVVGASLLICGVWLAQRAPAPEPLTTGA